MLGCLEGASAGEAGGLLSQRCTCRTSGLAHVACIARAAQSQDILKLVQRWWTFCPTCKQMCTGAMQLALARAWWALAISGFPSAGGSVVR